MKMPMPISGSRRASMSVVPSCAGIGNTSTSSATRHRHQRRHRRRPKNPGQAESRTSNEANSSSSSRAGGASSSSQLANSSDKWNSGSSSSGRSARSIETFLHSLMDEGRTRTDPSGVYNMINTVFQYVASNTKYFSEQSFNVNLQTLTDSLMHLHDSSVETWKREMFTALESQNLAMIRKLVRVNGFNLDAELGPVVYEKGVGQVEEEVGKNNGPLRHTSLTWACWRGNLNLVKNLLEEGANPGAWTLEDLCAVNFAAMKDSNMPVLRFLMESPKWNKVVGPNYCGVLKKVTPLISASRCGAIETVKYLLEELGAEVNHQDREGMSAIHHAASGGNLTIVKVLVDHGACAYLRDNEYRTVLHHLIGGYRSFSDGVLLKVLEYFVEERSIGVKTQAVDGTTALHEACQFGLVKVAKYLIERGSDLEAKRNGWQTPLWSCVMGKCPRKEVRGMVNLLMEKGADFQVKNCLGMTMAKYATQVMKNRTMAACLEEAMRVLRMRRMKALGDKRRQILGISNNLGEGQGQAPSPSHHDDNTPVAARTRIKRKKEVENVGVGGSPKNGAEEPGQNQQSFGIFTNLDNPVPQGEVIESSSSSSSDSSGGGTSSSEDSDVSSDDEGGDKANAKVEEEPGPGPGSNAEVGVMRYLEPVSPKKLSSSSSSDSEKEEKEVISGGIDDVGVKGKTAYEDISSNTEDSDGVNDNDAGVKDNNDIVVLRERKLGLRRKSRNKIDTAGSGLGGGGSGGRVLRSKRSYDLATIQTENFRRQIISGGDRSAGFTAAGRIKRERRHTVAVPLIVLSDSD